MLPIATISSAGLGPGTAQPETEPDGRLNRQVAYKQFQEQLLDGQLQAGQNLSQRDLAKKLGISLGALRELLPRLQAEGLLEVLPQRGIQITFVDLRMIRESYQMRLALEREATIHAVANMSDDDLNRQRQLHVELMERAQHGITNELLDQAQKTDSGFHDFLIEATGNKTLIQAYSVIAIRVRMIQLDRIRLQASIFTPSMTDHLNIIDAILTRDRQAAEGAMEVHIRNARDRAVSF